MKIRSLTFHSIQILLLPFELITFDPHQPSLFMIGIPDKILSMSGIPGGYKIYHNNNNIQTCSIKHIYDEQKAMQTVLISNDMMI